jgi:hypothetical protein
MEIAVGLALAFLFVGGLSFFGRSASGRLRKTLLQTPDRRVQDVRDGERVVLRGAALPTAEGPIASRCTGEAVVWWRVCVQTRAPPARTQTLVQVGQPQWETVHESTANRDVLLAEADGGRARILMSSALVHVRDVTITHDTEVLTRFFDASRAERTEEESGPPSGRGAFPDVDRLLSIPGASIRLIEERIEEGTLLSVLGTAHRVEPGRTADAYRHVQGASVVLDGAGAGADALLVTTEDIRALISEDRFAHPER